MELSSSGGGSYLQSTAILYSKQRGSDSTGKGGSHIWSGRVAKGGTPKHRTAL